MLPRQHTRGSSEPVLKALTLAVMTTSAVDSLVLEDGSLGELQNVGRFFWGFVGDFFSGPIKLGSLLLRMRQKS